MVWPPLLPSLPPLPPEEVHVWRASLEADDARVDELAAGLDDEERARATRFHRPLDGLRFKVYRGLLRRLLSGYLGCTPRQVAFRYGEKGKPFVDEGPSFNMSHSASDAVFAFRRSGEVGIDVEHHRRMDNLDAMTRMALSPWEQEVMSGIADEARLEAFFAAWVCKEAFVKLTGEGMSRPLHSFDVSFWPLGAPRIVRAESMAPEDVPSLRMLSTRAGVSAALAFRGSVIVRELVVG